VIRLAFLAALGVVTCACSKPAGSEPNTKQAPTPKATAAPPANQLGTLAPGTGISVGDHVPDVGALDLDGKPVRLADLVAKGPVLLVFYRGGWCPYCNYEIREMEAAYPEYQKRGVLPVAVSVDLPEEGTKTNAAYALQFPVLSDSPLAFVNAFHVAMHVDDETFAKMKGHGVDLEKSSGKAHHTIAIPALFLIDKQGVVRWAHDDPSYTVRPSTAQILTAIDAVNVGASL
jgi:peroxiredoxin